MSYETVVALNAAEVARIQTAIEDTKLRRAKEIEEKEAARNEQRLERGERNKEEGEVSVWRILMFYLILRIWLRSRLNEDHDDDDDGSRLNNNHTTTRAARRSTRLEQAASQQRFLAWADRLNQQRAQLYGQRPLSLESLQLVLRERELHDGDDYDGLLQFNEESGPAMQALLNTVGATREEIDRLPLRVVQPTDDLLLNNNDNNTTIHASGPQPIAEVSFNHCSVCLEAYQVGESVRTIPCFHTFHRQCIDSWLAQKAECPVCKHPALA